MSGSHRLAPDSLLFYKGVGGYDYAVKVRGKWYWVGHGPGKLDEVTRMVEAASRVMERVQGVPPRLQRIWDDHGMTHGALGQHLPQWTPAVGV